MRFERIGMALLLAAGWAVLPACSGESQVEQVEPAASSPEAIVKGGDDRVGAYDGVDSWWKPAPDHEEP